MISTNRFTLYLAVLHIFLLACDCVHSQLLQGRSWIARLTNKQDSSVVNNSIPNGKSSWAFASAAAAEQNDSGDDSNIDLLEDGDLIIPEADAYTQEHHPCEIGFEGIRMVLKQKKKNEERVILDGSIKGIAKPGRMLAIMGPSGSGKTTFLHALAGKIKQNSRIRLSGMRFLNGNTVPGDAFIPAAFIEQETNFFPYMTVKETLDFRVELKLGRTVDKNSRDNIVKELMSLLSLSKSANTIVGNNKIRGVSGGERKRLSIACEMIDSPPVIFLDEPTSGLDSYQSLQVVQTMRRLANSGKTVVAVIHQPSQRIFSLFDDLLLLSEGKQMYFGEVKNVRSYFDSIGFSCANEEGTAEHILDIVSLATSPNGKEENTLHGHIDTISAHAIKQTQNLDVRMAKGYSGLDVSSKEVKTLLKRARLHNTPSSNIFRQFKLLFHRSFKEILRGKSVILLKAVQQITLGLIYGGIYSLGRDQSSIMDRFGLLNLIVVGTANMALATTIRSFPKEKSIVVSEIGCHLYRTFPYLLSKAISEMPLTALLSSLLGVIIYPLAGLQKVKSKFFNFLGLSTLHSTACQATGLFLGAVSPSSDFALALLPPIVVLSIIFDGRNISIENIPKLLRFLPKVGVVRWGYEGLATNEFLGLEFTTFGAKRGPVIKTGEEALERFGLGRSTLPQIARAELCIIGGSWLLSYLGLSLTSDKYAVMEAPKEKA
jgi:ABC-type multidrug transport system ATPase subunit